MPLLPLQHGQKFVRPLFVDLPPPPSNFVGRLPSLAYAPPLPILNDQSLTKEELLLLPVPLIRNFSAVLFVFGSGIHRLYQCSKLKFGFVHRPAARTMRIVPPRKKNFFIKVR